jgi:2-polyprenyl-6-methoxyphenol hydroxylase-like FAD-dependent oxidoreductase
VYDAIRDAEPLTDPVAFRFPASVRRYYERLTRFPDRLLVLGDAVCSLNPHYSQGMTVAAMEAMTLRTQLSRGVPPNSIAFQRAVGRIVDNPWYISTTGDLNYAGVPGRRTLRVRMDNAFFSRLQYAATTDSTITDAFMRVAVLVDSPSALIRPRIIAKALRATRKGRAA